MKDKQLGVPSMSQRQRDDELILFLQTLSKARAPCDPLGSEAMREAAERLRELTAVAHHPV